MKSPIQFALASSDNCEIVNSTSAFYSTPFRSDPKTIRTDLLFKKNHGYRSPKELIYRNKRMRSDFFHHLVDYNLVIVIKTEIDGHILELGKKRLRV